MQAKYLTPSQPPPPVPRPNTIGPRRVIATVCLVWEVTPGDLVNRCLTPTVSRARLAGYFLCRMHTSRSSTEIGKAFGGRDHSTVLHGIKRARELMDTEPEFFGLMLEAGRLLMEGQ